jgi:hypothetical protein
LFGKSSCRRFFEKEVKTGKSPTKLLDSSIEVDIEITHALIILLSLLFFFATGYRRQTNATHQSRHFPFRLHVVQLSKTANRFSAGQPAAITVYKKRFQLQNIFQNDFCGNGFLYVGLYNGRKTAEKATAVMEIMLYASAI